MFTYIGGMQTTLLATKAPSRIVDPPGTVPAQLTFAHFESGMLSELLQCQRLVIPQNSKKLAFLQRQLSSLLITLQYIQATLQKQYNSMCSRVAFRWEERPKYLAFGGKIVVANPFRELKEFRGDQA
jgi:hypothetical protein